MRPISIFFFFSFYMSASEVMLSPASICSAAGSFVLRIKIKKKRKIANLIFKVSEWKERLGPLVLSAH